MKKISLAVLLLIFTASCGHIHIIKLEDPLSFDEHFKLASIYESKGEADLALREYEAASGADKKRSEAYFAAGNLYLKINRPKDAEVSYLNAIKITPGIGAYYNNLGWLYMELGQMDRAEEAIKEALKIDPEKSYAYLDTLGVIQMKNNDLQEAEKTLVSAAILAPETEKNGLNEIYSHLIELYKKTGDDEKAATIEDKKKGLEK